MTINNIDQNIIKLLAEMTISVGIKITLNELIKQISEILDYPDNNKLSELYKLVPLMTRIGIDKSIKLQSERKYKLSKKAYEFVKQSIELLKNALSKKWNKSRNLLNKLRKSDFCKRYLNETINEPPDPVTQRWSKPKNAVNLLDDICSKVPKRKVIILNFAHGSTRIAIILGFLLELLKFKVKNIPVRFSIHKLKDEEIKFPTKNTTNELIKFLKKGYKILIFDEDVASGETFKKAYECIINSVFEHYKDNIMMGAIGVSAVFSMDAMHLINVSANKVYELYHLKDSANVATSSINIIIIMNYLTKNAKDKKIVLVYDKKNENVISNNKEMNLRINIIAEKIERYLKALKFDVKIKSMKELAEKWQEINDDYKLLFLAGGNINRQNVISILEEGINSKIPYESQKRFELINFETFSLFTYDDDIYTIDPSGVFRDENTFNPDDFKAILKTLPAHKKKRVSNEEMIRVQSNIDTLIILLNNNREEAYKIIIRIKNDKEKWNKFKNELLSDKKIKRLIKKFK